MITPSILSDRLRVSGAPCMLASSCMLQKRAHHVACTPAWQRGGACCGCLVLCKAHRWSASAWMGAVVQQAGARRSGSRAGSHRRATFGASAAHHAAAAPVAQHCRRPCTSVLHVQEQWQQISPGCGWACSHAACSCSPLDERAAERQPGRRRHQGSCCPRAGSSHHTPLLPLAHPEHIRPLPLPPCLMRS